MAVASIETCIYKSYVHLSGGMARVRSLCLRCLVFFSLGFCSQKSVSCCTYDILGADVSTVVLIDFYAIYFV